ncbi:MAG: holo-ACP synthase [Vallitaleaceae bacterium]|jgi:holo-[acyl-carrier protein] synthase|nr:holo-ACP synthase [Vallitaleaceae bacterium]
MIIGIGNDIIEIKRIENAISKQRFLQRYFTDKEIELYNNRKNNPEVLAGNFAVKEAVAKTFGTGFKDFSMKEIEVLRDEAGKPFIILYGKAKTKADLLSIDMLHVSISHNRTDVVAYVIGEKI